MIDKKIFYIKHNKTRLPQFDIRTEILLKDNEKVVYKIAKESSKDFLKKLLKNSEILNNYELPFEIVPVTQLDQFTLEFPYLNGRSLFEELSNAYNEKKFYGVFDGYYDLLRAIPHSKSKLSKEFKSIFGKNGADVDYESLDIGILDFNLENIIKEENGQLFLIDYEWTYDFPIPLDFIMFRSLLYASTNIESPHFVKFNDLIDRYIVNNGNLEIYKNWELNFQRKISRNYIPDNAIDKLIENETDLNLSKNLDIKALAREREILKNSNSDLEKRNQDIFEKNLDLNKEISLLKENLNVFFEVKKTLEQNIQTLEQNIQTLEQNIANLTQENVNLTQINSYLNQELIEHNAFKQGLIWKYLTVYRRIKHYPKNFITNIRNLGLKMSVLVILRRIKQLILRNRNSEVVDPYECWVKNNKLSLWDRVKLYLKIRKLDYQPRISIVMPVYNVDVKWIKAAVKSIKDQVYKNWELCIADDASTNADLKKYLKRISKSKKINVVFREKNGHISEASNSALKLATGEFISLMDNDDVIYPHALAEVVKVLNKNKDADLIYSDEDKLELNGERVEPFFKPDWSPDLFLSNNYLCHFTTIRKKLIDEIGGFRKGLEGSQDYDLFLRVTEKTKIIEHIPDVLYSWRKIPGSTAAVYSDKNYAEKASKKALEDAIERRGLNATVEKGLFPCSFRVKYKINGNPLVSILIPTKDKYEYIERCISSLLEKTTYQNIEIVIIDTGSTEKKVLDYYETLKSNPKVKFVYWKKKFNYSAVNNFGVKTSKGDYVLLLNNDTEIISPDWIEGMLEHAQRDEIGVVGVKLYYPDNTIQHAGVVLGINGGTGRGVAGHAFKHFPKEIMGFPVQKDIIRNYSAVTAACFMVSRKKFNEVGGLEEKFRIAFNDVDFNLKLMKKGYYNIYTPYVELYHHESVSVGTPEKATRDVEEFGREIDLMYEKWEDLLVEDPFYNRNLTLTNENFGIG